MELQVTTALAAGVFLGLLLAAGLLLPRGLNDVVAVFLLGFGLFYGFRPLLFVLGLDVPFPEHLFPAEESAALLTLTLVGLTLYLACTVLGIAAMTHTGARGWAPSSSSARWTSAGPSRSPCSSPRWRRRSRPTCWRGTAGSAARSTPPRWTRPWRACSR